jgi:hypothetical protein
LSQCFLCFPDQAQEEEIRFLSRGDYFGEQVTIISKARLFSNKNRNQNDQTFQNLLKLNAGSSQN